MQGPARRIKRLGFDPSAFNIEQVVNTLDELRRGDEHVLYPFVGAWVPKLYEVAGPNLAKVNEFRSAIIRRLRDDWVQLRYTSNAAYFSGLLAFQEQFQHPLRVFTLNYDLCVENNCGKSIQRGFDESHRWDWRLFEERPETESKLLLYKLHGSIDWTYDEGKLICVDGFSQIAPDDIAIIFGTTYKLQYVDPFLFFAYELRRYTLDFARLILTIGYGFADEHINGILSQALNRDPNRRLISVSLITGEDDEDRQRKERERLQWIQQQLKLPNLGQLTLHNSGAMAFISQGLTLSFLGEVFPAQDENLFEELATGASTSRSTEEPREVSPTQPSSDSAVVSDEQVPPPAGLDASHAADAAKPTRKRSRKKGP